MLKRETISFHMQCSLPDSLSGPPDREGERWRTGRREKMSRRVSNHLTLSCSGASSFLSLNKGVLPTFSTCGNLLQGVLLPKQLTERNRNEKMPWLGGHRGIGSRRKRVWRRKGEGRQEWITETRRREGLIMVLTWKFFCPVQHHNQSTHLLWIFITEL